MLVAGIAGATVATTLTIAPADAADGVIPDPEFARCIRDNMELPANTVLTPQILNRSVQYRGNSFQGIDCSPTTSGPYTIKSLEGAQYLKKIDTLTVSSKEITDLNPVAGMTNLTELNVNESRVTDLTPLAGLKLAHLTITHDPVLTDLSPIAKLAPTLFWLDVSYDGSIADISVAKGLKELISFGGAGTQISDITPLKDLPKLTFLSLPHAQVSDISSFKDGFPSLIEAALRGNHIADLHPLTITRTPSGMEEIQNISFEPASLFKQDVLTHAPTRPVPGKPVTVTVPALSPRSGKANLKVKAPTGYSVAIQGSKATITCTKAATCGPDGTDKNAYSLTFATWASGTVSVVFDDAQKPKPAPALVPTVTTNITGNYRLGDKATVKITGLRPQELVELDFASGGGVGGPDLTANAEGVATWTGVLLNNTAGEKARGDITVGAFGEESGSSTNLTVPWVRPSETTSNKSGTKKSTGTTTGNDKTTTGDKNTGNKTNDKNTGKTTKTGNTGKTGTKKPGKLPSTGN